MGSLRPDAIRLALDGRCLIREQLSRRRGRADRDTTPGEVIALGVGRAAGDPARVCTGYLCFGPGPGAAVTFVRPERWLPEVARSGHRAKPCPPSCALFLAAYGPATRDEFARWWGVRPPEVKTLFPSSWPTS